MDADDAWSAELRHLLASDPDPLALGTVAAERLLDGDLGPDQAPPAYAEVAALLAAASLASQSASTRANVCSRIGCTAGMLTTWAPPVRRTR